MKKRVMVLSLVFAAQQGAFEIRHDERLVAESLDKKTVLLQRSGRGPEGGASVEFVLRRMGEVDKSYLISRTFSPGDGSKPETIGDAACRKALEALKQESSPLRLFVNPHACASRDRNKAVMPMADIEAAGAQKHDCKADEVPYFTAGCEGAGTVQCWPQKVRPTPMEACLCSGQQGNAPLPGGGLRWRYAGKCKL